MTRPLSRVRALLVDLEGTVYQDKRLIPGAVDRKSTRLNSSHS